MRISLSPQGPEEPISVSVNGDTLTINGDTLDLSVVTEGAEIEGSLAESLHPLIAGKPIYRQAGELHLTLRLPLPLDCTDLWMCFPEPLTITGSGPVDLPFATYSEQTEQAVDGGVVLISTTHRWHQSPEVHTLFVPDPVEEEATGGEVE